MFPIFHVKQFCANEKLDKYKLEVCQNNKCLHKTHFLKEALIVGSFWNTSNYLKKKNEVNCFLLKDLFLLLELLAVKNNHT